MPRLLPNRNAYKLEGDFVDKPNSFGQKFDYRPLSPGYGFAGQTREEMGFGQDTTTLLGASSLSIGLPGDYNDFEAGT